MGVRSKFSERKRVAVSCVGDAGRAKQSMRDECNINNIVASYRRTGVMRHVSDVIGRYDFAPSHSFHEALNTVREAERMFAELPGAVRKRFRNDPAEFLAFMEKPKENEAEMRELGILPAKPAEKPEASSSSSASAEGDQGKKSPGASSDAGTVAT